MPEFTTREFAELLGVTDRRARMLLEERVVPSRRLPSGQMLVDAADAHRYLARRSTVRGRAVSAGAAWGLLAEFSGIRAGWLSGSARARMRRLAAESDAETLARRLAGRATASRWWSDDPSALTEHLLLTGRSAADRLDTRLVPSDGMVSGYVPAGSTVEAFADAHLLVAASDGTVELRPNTMPAALTDLGLADLPIAAVAADLATSVDARERAAGITALDVMRRAWLG